MKEKIISNGIARRTLVIISLIAMLFLTGCPDDENSLTGEVVSSIDSVEIDMRFDKTMLYKDENTTVEVIVRNLRDMPFQGNLSLRPKGLSSQNAIEIHRRGSEPTVEIQELKLRGDSVVFSFDIKVIGDTFVVPLVEAIVIGDNGEEIRRVEDDLKVEGRAGYWTK